MSLGLKTRSIMTRKIGSQKIKRIYHTWDKWECYPCDFYENQKKGFSSDECEEIYKNLLSHIPSFRAALQRVVNEWPNSCEHYLTNEKMNRIAWLGQASLAITFNVPSRFRSGYFLLSEEQRAKADEAALEFLNIWLVENWYKEVDLIGAGVKSAANIY